MFKKLVNKIIGDPNKKILDGLSLIVSEVEALEPHYKAFSDDEIRDETMKLRERAQAGEELDDLLTEAGALIREASRRTTGLRHYDVQIMGGTLLHQGNVIEMRTGEGKTLAGTLPLFLNALTGEGVHLVTVNDYLVRRDGGWMGKIFNFLGMTVGCIGSEQFSGLYDPEYVSPGTELEDERLVHWRPCTRKQAYLADITYGTSSEFGFDYLRDNMVNDPERLVQRGQIVAIIDEVDNVLIDESRTPLIISGPASQSGKEYSRFSDYVRRLKENTADEGEEPNGDYDIDHKARAVSLTEIGIAEIERRILEINADTGDSLYDPRFFHLTYYLDNAMKAQYLFHRDQQYMVMDGQVVIVDDFTGRPMPSRRYSDGLHEAIEAKESVEIKRETTTVATITLQNYFRMYGKLSGMTGTALTDSEEFDRIYELGVFPLPTNVQYVVDSGKMGLKERTKDLDGSKGIYYTKPSSDEAVFFKRTDHADQVFGSETGKDVAIVDEIERIHHQGRPVLVGTTSVEHSEVISTMLRQRSIKHNVLNAKMHRSEASVVAQAGRKHAVTISTNMAGRGTDILLGGNAEGLASSELEQELFDRVTLEQLAKILFTKSASAARDYAAKSPKLDVRLVDALLVLEAEYEEAAKKIAATQLPTYIAQRFYDEQQVDMAVSRKMLSSIRLGALQQAREYLQDNNVDTALVEEAVRLNELHTGYEVASRDSSKKATFLAEQLFDQHYTARAALIRAVMGDDIAAAEKIIAAVPGLSEQLVERVKQTKVDTEAERKEVWQVGGLHVVGSERHESRRIDNQLRGRAARQGDPGSSRFFISLEDDLMLRFGGERLNSFYTKFNIPEDLPIENKMVDKLIENSQSRLEGYNFDVRKNLVEYDDVMSRQRESIYSERREILLSDDLDLDEKIAHAFDGVTAKLSADYLDNYIDYARGEITRVVDDYTTDATNDVNTRAVLVRLRGLLPELLSVDIDELENLPAPDLINRLEDFAHDNLDRGVNIYQLLQAMRSFVPLLPGVPNVAALTAPRRDRLSARESIRRDFMGRVEELYNDFLAQHIDAAERSTIWQKAQGEINESFVRFSVEGASIESLQGQQDKFKTRIDTALSDLLMDGLRSVDSEQLTAALDAYVIKQSNNWRKRLGEEEYRNFQRTVLLGAIDREWRDYLTAMDDLRREIGLESFAQRDPKVMYKKRSYEMFTDMRSNINEFVAKNYFLQIERSQQFVQQQEQVAQTNVQSSVKRDVASGYQKVKRLSGKGSEVKREVPKLGRNEACWCGSGKKYKACHLKTDRSGATNAPSKAAG